MADDTRARFAEAVRAGDLAEAALRCCVEADPSVDVDAELDRLDGMGEQLRAHPFSPTDPHAAATALSGYLADELGFRGDTDDYHDPRNGLVTEVLDRRRGLPIALSIVYVCVGRLAAIDVYGLNTPAHFLVGVGVDPSASRPHTRPAWVVDPFHGGRVSDGPTFVDGLRRNVGDAVDPATLAPAETATVIRRLLNNLTRDYLARADPADALWTAELKRLLPDTGPSDVATHARVLLQLGRYLDAARTVEAYIAEHAGDESDAAELAGLARRARARLN